MNTIDILLAEVQRLRAELAETERQRDALLDAKADAQKALVAAGIPEDEALGVLVADGIGRLHTQVDHLRAYARNLSIPIDAITLPEDAHLDSGGKLERILERMEEQRTNLADAHRREAEALRRADAASASLATVLGEVRDLRADLDELRLVLAAMQAADSVTMPVSDECRYPCYRCGALRTAAEGGSTFTVCDDCWDAKTQGKP